MTELEIDDRPASALDDEADREELRKRYYGLLQELRVLLPGVQVLVAFLLTVPFAQGFAKLDATGRNLYGVAMCTGVLAVIAFMSPTVFHRVAGRRSRSARLQWGIRLVRIGLVFVAASLVTALCAVCRLVFGSAQGWAIGLATTATLVVAWVVLPLAAGRNDQP